MRPTSDKSLLTMDLLNKQNNLWFTTKIQALVDNTTKIQISEKLFHEAQNIVIGKVKAEREVYCVVHVIVESLYMPPYLSS